MTKRETEQVKQAIELLMDEDQHFQEAIVILAKLVGWRYPAFEEMIDPSDIIDAFEHAGKRMPHLRGRST